METTTFAILLIGIGLIGIAVAIYFKQTPQLQVNCCNAQQEQEPYCTHKPSDYPINREEVHEQVYLPFNLSNTCTYQTFHINVGSESDNQINKNYIVLAKTIEKERQAAKALDFLVYNSAGSTHRIVDIKEPKRKENTIHIPITIDNKGKSTIEKYDKTVRISNPDNYIYPGDIIADYGIGESHKFTDDDKNVGGHICNIKAI